MFGFYYSKLLGCKQKIIDLLPKIEVALNNIKEADNSVMQMQGKRQREIWHLLKIACVSSFWTLCSSFQCRSQRTSTETLRGPKRDDFCMMVDFTVAKGSLRC